MLAILLIFLLLAFLQLFILANFPSDNLVSFDYSVTWNFAILFVLWLTACILVHFYTYSVFCQQSCFIFTLLPYCLQFCLFSFYCLHWSSYNQLLFFLSVILFHSLAHFLRASNIACFLCYCLHAYNFSNLFSFLSVILFYFPAHFTCFLHTGWIFALFNTNSFFISNLVSIFVLFLGPWKKLFYFTAWILAIFRANSVSFQ